MGERFGTFKAFLERHDDKVNRKRRKDIAKVIEDHYEKYGSSEDETDNENKKYLGRERSINVSLVREDETPNRTLPEGEIPNRP